MNTDQTTLTIRDVETADEKAVAALLTEAFPSETEARLVHTLRHCGALVLEQVAIDGSGRIAGHIAYSRVTPAAIGPGQGLQVACLAPVTVSPGLQRTGIGSALIQRSLEDLKAKGEDLVLVLGPPAYFPRFGFDATLAEKVKGPYAGAAFMALALTDAGTRDLPVEVAFATPFEEFE
ncbi:N-acetyltransferase [Roseibium denhamense]|uniref:Acetyltransferase n=1 Tax=Roseibium denhamense TaxID=76305 RepID=A0ABY1P1R0_9HYPH|nr:N-acetyltransferase [Roseibium denhamense]MTI04924.1 N-acetyltransferase [Roseibium denhamense]SMP23109.1 putative acetyltransferase [Roseibium denhamense]